VHRCRTDRTRSGYRGMGWGRCGTGWRLPDRRRGRFGRDLARVRRARGGKDSTRTRRARAGRNWDKTSAASSRHIGTVRRTRNPATIRRTVTAVPCRRTAILATIRRTGDHLKARRTAVGGSTVGALRAGRCGPGSAAPAEVVRAGSGLARRGAWARMAVAAPDRARRTLVRSAARGPGRGRSSGHGSARSQERGRGSHRARGSCTPSVDDPGGRLSGSSVRSRTAPAVRPRRRRWYRPT
jgi:hypothetical protein